MNVQTIKRDGKPEYVVLPWADYQALVEAAEDALDSRSINDIRQRIASSEEEMVSSEVAEDLLAGTNPIRVWREYRGLTQEKLALKAGVSKAYLSQIETAKRIGAVKTLQAIARALGVTVDDLQ